jgi:hypothetical protein
MHDSSRRHQSSIHHHLHLPLVDKVGIITIIIIITIALITTITIS